MRDIGQGLFGCWASISSTAEQKISRRFGFFLCWFCADQSTVVDGGPALSLDGIISLLVLYVPMYVGVQIHTTMMMGAIVQQTRHIAWCCLGARPAS